MTSPVVYVTSSACHGAGNCVAAGLLPGGDVVVRDTKTGAELVFTADEWVAFVRGVKDGEFDLGQLPAPGRGTVSITQPAGVVVTEHGRSRGRTPDGSLVETVLFRETPVEVHGPVYGERRDVGIFQERRDG